MNLTPVLVVVYERTVTDVHGSFNPKQDLTSCALRQNIYEDYRLLQSISLLAMKGKVLDILLIFLGW